MRVCGPCPNGIRHKARPSPSVRPRPLSTRPDGQVSDLVLKRRVGLLIGQAMLSLTFIFIPRSQPVAGLHFILLFGILGSGMFTGLSGRGGNSVSSPPSVPTLTTAVPSSRGVGVSSTVMRPKKHFVLQGVPAAAAADASDGLPAVWRQLEEATNAIFEAKPSDFCHEILYQVALSLSFSFTPLLRPLFFSLLF